MIQGLNPVFKLDGLGLGLNTWPLHNLSERKIKSTQSKYKNGQNYSKCDLDQKNLHFHVCVLLSNIICKFDEEALRNGKILANAKFLWWTDGQSDPYV